MEEGEEGGEGGEEEFQVSDFDLGGEVESSEVRGHKERGCGRPHLLTEERGACPRSEKHFWDMVELCCGHVCIE